MIPALGSVIIAFAPGTSTPGHPHGLKDISLFDESGGHGICSHQALWFLVYQFYNISLIVFRVQVPSEDTECFPLVQVGYLVDCFLEASHVCRECFIVILPDCLKVTHVQLMSFVCSESS